MLKLHSKCTGRFYLAHISLFYSIELFFCLFLGKEKSIWQKEMGEELYRIIIQCISIFHPKGDKVVTDESTRHEMENFYKENKRNFHISKNTKKWKYEFCINDNDVLQRFDDGLPKLIINTKTSAENPSHKVGNDHKKVVVPKEKVIFPVYWFPRKR